MRGWGKSTKRIIIVKQYNYTPGDWIIKKNVFISNS